MRGKNVTCDSLVTRRYIKVMMFAFILYQKSGRVLGA